MLVLKRLQCRISIPDTYHASLHLTRKLLSGLSDAAACLSRFLDADSFGTSMTDACISCGAGMPTTSAGLLPPCCAFLSAVAVSLC